MANALPYWVSGPADAPVLVFLHGWPMDGQVWDGVVARMRASHRCVVINMPWYGGRAEAAERGYTPLGYSFQTAADMVAGTVRDAVGEMPATLVGFDAGSFWGQAVLGRHPEVFSRAVLVAVGVAHAGRATVADLRWNWNLFIRYQMFIIIAYLLGLLPLVGGLVDRLYVRALSSASEYQIPDGVLNTNMGYAYLRRTTQLVGEFLRLRKPLYPGSVETFPQQPTLFMYGTDDFFEFFDKDWERLLKERNDGSSVVPFDGGRHYLMVTQEELFVNTLEKWLQETA